MTDTDPRYSIIADWENAHKLLQIAKDAEAAARQRLIDVCYPQHAPGSELDGVHNIPLENNYVLKGEFGFSYSVNKDELPATLLALSDKGEAGSHAADTLFRYKPELNVTPYKLLSPSLKAIVDIAVTTKPSLPSFKIVQSKKGAKS